MGTPSRFSLVVLLRVLLGISRACFQFRPLSLARSFRPPLRRKQQNKPTGGLRSHHEALTEECKVKFIRRTATTHTIGQPRSSQPKPVYLFYEKATGTAHFHVEAGPEGELPVDHAAGLLAMHCMVRGQSPADYLIMVPADPNSLSGLAEKAQQILESGHSAKSSVRLTRREEEVLDGVLKSLANKEIASLLNLSERTVKFHVSSLLAKFKVRSRMELLRESSRLSLKSLPAAVSSPASHFGPFVAKDETFHAPLNSGKILPLARARMMA